MTDSSKANARAIKLKISIRHHGFQYYPFYYFTNEIWIYLCSDLPVPPPRKLPIVARATFLPKASPAIFVLLQTVFQTKLKQIFCLKVTRYIFLTILQFYKLRKLKILRHNSLVTFYIRKSSQKVTITNFSICDKTIEFVSFWKYIYNKEKFNKYKP